MLTDDQKLRLTWQAAELRRTPEWATIRQFCTAEAAADDPDFTSLKSTLMTILEKIVDDEIEAAKAKYRALAAKP